MNNFVLCFSKERGNWYFVTTRPRLSCINLWQVSDRYQRPEKTNIKWLCRFHQHQHHGLLPVCVLLAQYSQEALCFSLYASQCTRMHLRIPKITKISWGSTPQIPLEWRTPWQPCSLLKLITLPPPPDKKRYVRSWCGTSDLYVYYVLHMGQVT